MADDPKKDNKAVVSEEQKEFGSYMRLSRVGYDFSASVLACGFLGWLLDSYLNSRPWGLLIMIVIGFIVGLTNMWRMLGGCDKPPNKREGQGKGS